MSDSDSGGRVWGPWATAGFGILVLIVYGVAQLAGAFALAIPSMMNGLGSPSALADALESNFGMVLALSVFLSTVFGTGLTIGIVKIRNASIVQYLGLLRVPGKTLLVFIAVAAALGAASDTLTVILGRPLVPQFMLDAYGTSGSPLILGAAVVVFAPAFEETFFRGFLIAGFRRSRLGNIGAVVLVSVVWALIHVQYGAYEIAVIFVFGILLGVAQVRTGSLWCPLVMHAFNNLVATVEAALVVNGLIG